MDWNETEDRQALTGIVEMLVALAFLADRACSRSSLVRNLILTILTPVEAFARNFVIAEARAAGFVIDALPVPSSGGDGAAAAMRLAACFRALAIVLQNLPMRSARSAHRLMPPRISLPHSARILLNASGETTFTAPKFDTS